jgi:hypothetical protein
MLKLHVNLTDSFAFGTQVKDVYMNLNNSEYSKHNIENKQTCYLPCVVPILIF